MPAKSPSSRPGLEVLLVALGRRIRTQREALGISAGAAAGAAGISRVTLHRIERGGPSVTIGAWLNVIDALGLELALAARGCLPRGEGKAPTVPEVARKARPCSGIRIADYPQLRRLAWGIDEKTLLTPGEALGLYERNWRHLDTDLMPTHERELLDMLIETPGKGRLLV